MAGLLLIGFSYGGMPTMTSTVTADCFGTQNYGTNFSIANMSMLPASFGATIVGAIQTGSGTYVRRSWCSSASLPWSFCWISPSVGPPKNCNFPLVPLFSVKGGKPLIILQNSQMNSIPIVYIVIIDKH